MDNSGKRLGIAMLTVVVVLGLNALAVMTGTVNSTYARWFGDQPERHLAVTGAPAVAPGSVLSRVECTQPDPKRAPARSLVPVTGAPVHVAPVARMC